MSGAPVPGLELGFSSPSHADTGDNLIDQPFNFSFGDKIAGAPKPNALVDLGKNIAIAVVVAVAARYVFENFLK